LPSSSRYWRCGSRPLISSSARRHHAAWTRAQLAFEIHRALPPLPAGVDQAAVLDECVAEALAGRADGADVVCLGPAPDVTDVSELGVRASDGQSVYRPPGQERYITAGQLDIEQNLLTSTRALSVLVAPAGTGKTHTPAAFARAWIAHTGRRVIGLATSTNAARVMIGEGLPEGYNTTQFLGKMKDSDQTRGAMPIGADDVLVIDEASQVSTADLARIVAVAKAARARVVLTGDTAQLGAVEASGLMRLIAHDLGHWELHEVRRFDAGWERAASLKLRAGRTSVIGQYDAHGGSAPAPKTKRKPARSACGSLIS
jgi:hypothetical protein